MAEDEQKLGVWSYPHFVKYMCEIMNRLSRNRPKHVQTIVDKALAAVANNDPGTMARYRCTPTTQRTRRQAVQRVANCICDVVTRWAEVEIPIIMRTAVQEIFVPSPSGELRARQLYEDAVSVVREAENIAFEYGLTNTDLQACALFAFEEFSQLDDKHKDAALCVMEIGHYDHAVRIIKHKDE